MSFAPNAHLASVTPNITVTLGVMSLATAAIALLSYWRSFSKKQSKEIFPGPPGIPILGNLLQINPNYFPLQLEQWSCSKNDRIATVARQNLYRYSKNYERTDCSPPRLPTNDSSLPVHPPITASDWKQSRQWIAPQFAPGKVARSKSLVIHHALLLRERLDEHAKNHQITYEKWFPKEDHVSSAVGKKHTDRVFYNPKELSPVWSEFSDRALAVIINYAFAHGKDELVPPDMINLIQKVLATINHHLVTPLSTWRFYSTASDRDANKAVTLVNEVIDNIAESIRKDKENGKRKDEGHINTLLESLLYEKVGEGDDFEDAELARSAEKASRLTLEQIKGNLIQVIIAGYGWLHLCDQEQFHLKEILL
ncbi:hypothetical protein BC938DRAFT_482543 [Jimgerdemannia flammicorona]|uniref:Cytochrome P450 n=1 Tax=Jimgerdemannia flammicorona TaxID=994334 RepID=A0A433QWD5_9FUNG|nr:hypothetical protein BC938DRAFT_482543 [Jimgerdemannia flammicorona]